ncbi:hypothetical protein B0H66DRAFT_401209 [Apodospora peruviana]|uniref:Uncharacterized protein n=1 Tax=Apodospora peruviana TaxID=516989 RepID=A0AAE0LZG8_9PEZI|nr:hypothetical protein B0H66DRAFT_401209 [Apodospora peruviana]
MVIEAWVGKGLLHEQGIRLFPNPLELALLCLGLFSPGAAGGHPRELQRTPLRKISSPKGRRVVDFRASSVCVVTSADMVMWLQTVHACSPVPAVCISGIGQPKETRHTRS